MLRLISINLRQLLLRASHSSRNSYLFSISSMRSFSELLDSNQNLPFTVSYLQNSCGFSLEKALAASKKLRLEEENTHNPDTVLNLLRTHGLTLTHISSLINKRPSLLLCDVYKNLKPNLELFKSMNFSDVNLYKILAKDPRVLESEARVLVKLLKDHGFSEKQIASLTMKRSTLYTLSAQKNLEPKFKYFRSLGFKDFEIAKMLSIEPYLLERSLENWIIPRVSELKRIVGTDENVLKVIRAWYPILRFNVKEVIERNMLSIISHGVPKSKVSKFFLAQPRFMLAGADKINEAIYKVMKLGFDPNKLVFVLAIRTMISLSDALWERKLEAYRSYGLSTDEIYSAYKLQPMFMMISEKKIGNFFEFFLNKLKMEPSVLANHPNLLLLSMEKRIIPRCSVIQILMSNGFIREDFNLIQSLKMTEKEFVEKLVSAFQGVVPDVVKAHQGKIEFKGFATDLKL